MSIFVKATPAPTVKTTNTQTISLVLAGIMTVLAVAQLFTFEKFGDVLRVMWLPGGATYAPLYAALIVTFEVFSVPFLLRMTLSPLMRITSMVSGWLVITAWLMLFLWQLLSGNVIVNSGILGATVSVPVGWWSVFVMLGLGVLAGWVAWGMWPSWPRRKVVK